MHTGSCLCGGVRFQIHSMLEPIQVCHCRACRKAQGVAMATNIPVRADALELLAGAALLSEYESSPGKFRAFCARCGSPIHSSRTSHPEVVRVRAGTLDGEIEARPAFHFHVASQANWWEIRDDLPRFANEPPGIS